MNRAIDTTIIAMALANANSEISKEGAEASGGGEESVPVTLTHPFMAGIVGCKAHWMGYRCRARGGYMRSSVYQKHARLLDRKTVRRIYAITDSLHSISPSQFSD